MKGLIAGMCLVWVGIWLYIISDKNHIPLCDIECKRKQVVERLSENTANTSTNKILLSRAEVELQKQKQIELELSGKQAKIKEALNKFNVLNDVIAKANDFDVNTLD